MMSVSVSIVPRKSGKLSSKLSMFEQKIQKNKAEGRSSLPSLIVGLVEDESKLSFDLEKVKKSQIYQSKMLKESRGVPRRQLSLQLQDARGNLQKDAVETTAPPNKKQQEPGKSTCGIATLGLKTNTVPTNNCNEEKVQTKKMEKGGKKKLSQNDRDEVEEEEQQKFDSTRCNQNKERKATVQNKTKNPEHSKKNVAERTTTTSNSRNDDDDDKVSEMKAQIAAIQKRLGTIQTETRNDIEKLRVDFEQRKTQVRQKVEQEFATEQQGTTVIGNSNCDKQESIVTRQKAVINYLRKSNAELRQTRDEIQKDVQEMKIMNVALDRESVEIAKHYDVLKNHYYRKVREDHDALVKARDTLLNEYKPMYRAAMTESCMYEENERKLNQMYRRCLQMISDQIFYDDDDHHHRNDRKQKEGQQQQRRRQKVEPILKDNVAFILCECEATVQEAKCELPNTTRSDDDNVDHVLTTTAAGSSSGIKRNETSTTKDHEKNDDGGCATEKVFDSKNIHHKRNSGTKLYGGRFHNRRG